jgi:hypothetical protein
MKIKEQYSRCKTNIQDSINLPRLRLLDTPEEQYEYYYHYYQNYYFLNRKSLERLDSVSTLASRAASKRLQG